MKLALELTKRERKALEHLSQHVTADIEIMSDRSEPADQRATAKLLIEGQKVIADLLRLTTPN